MKMTRHRSIGWWMSISLVTVFILVIGVFSYFKMDFLVKGVQIKAKIIRQGDSSLVQVVGNAKNAIHLKLNGREIFIDKDGNFSEAVYLLPGLSIVSLKTVDKFGKISKKKFEIWSKPEVKIKVTPEIKTEATTDTKITIPEVKTTKK